MLKDGIKADKTVVCLLLKLYMKNCQISKRNGYQKEHVDSAQVFIETITNEGFMGHQRVISSEEMYSDLIKCACLAGEEERALSILESMEMWYNIRPTALSYEPLLQSYSQVKGALDASEEILTLMLNKNVKLSSKCVDSVISGYLKHTGNNIEAIDKVQEIFNMNGIRPSPSILLDILDVSLRKKDVFEARRVVVVIQQLIQNVKVKDLDYVPIMSFHPGKNERSYNVTNMLLSQHALEQRFQFHGLNLN